MRLDKQLEELQDATENLKSGNAIFELEDCYDNIQETDVYGVGEITIHSNNLIDGEVLTEFMRLCHKAKNPRHVIEHMQAFFSLDSINR